MLFGGGFATYIHASFKLHEVAVMLCGRDEPTFTEKDILFFD
jgi:hypothetical protein